MKVMSKRCLQIITALLCVLLLAGCGAKAQSTRQNPLESPAGAKAERFDPPETARAAVEHPDITVSVRWAEEAEGQEAIRTLAAEYFTLMGTILAAPEASYESVCCSEEVLQELTLYGWMASTNLYPRISIQVTLSRPETYPDGTVRVTAGLKTALKSCRDISRTSFTSDANLESIDFSEEHRLTLSGAGENWTVAWDAFSSDFGRMESGYATNHRDDAFCAEPIRSYFSLRANALDGGYVAGNPEFCIGALRSDAFDFAQALLKDRPEILRVYRAESRAVNLGQFRRIDGDAATQVPVVQMLQGKWKLQILYELCIKCPMRFGELKKMLKPITNTALTNALKELEADDLIQRIQYNEMPLRVEYSLTLKGQDLLPVFYAIMQWGIKYIP